ncbi:hypothetical protein TDB9533_04667 [Thalassocella blandensis]|nr:hypothetical protein TDB9533_04667 [Thalassocella blandensis]
MKYLTKTLVAVLFVLSAAEVFASESHIVKSDSSDIEISLLGGVVSTRDPAFAENSEDTDAIRANSARSALIILNLFQQANYGGGDNHYEFLVAQTNHQLTLDSSGEQIELDIDATHYHIGGTYGFDPNKYVRPFFGLTAGLSEYKSSNGHSDSFVSGSIVGGLKMDFSKRIALRIEARLLATLVEENTSIFCENANCSFAVEGDTWIQYQMNAGVLIKI